MSNQDLFIVLIVLFCTALSFLMSGMEAGVLALSPLRIRQLRRAGSYQAEVLHQFLQRPENFLWTILVGNTVANFTVISIVVIFLKDWLQGHLFWMIAIFAAVAFLFYIL